MGVGDGCDEQICVIQPSAFVFQGGLPASKELCDVVSRVERLNRLLEALQDAEVLFASLRFPGPIGQFAGADHGDPNLFDPHTEDVLLEGTMPL